MSMFSTDYNYNNSALLTKKSQEARATAAIVDASKPQELSTSKTSDSLTMKFKLTSGDSRSITVNSPKEGIDEEFLMQVMAQIIDNGIALEDSPIEQLGASARQTTTIKYDL